MATPVKPARRARVITGTAKAALGAVRYADDRLGLGRWTRANLRKLFPSHWSFLLGEVALYSFVLLVLTGTFLTLFYKPSAGLAYASVVEISQHTRGGLLMRQLHHWSATVFVLAIVAHLFRVFFTGAFRKPRELTWMLGVVLFATVLFEAFLGVSLTGDQLAFTGLREMHALLLSVPLVGSYLAAFAFDGEFPGAVVPRMFALHVLLIPGILLAVVPLHGLILTWRQKHTERRGGRAAETRVTGGPFFPYFVVKNAATALFTIGVIAALATFAVVNPVWEHGAYDPGRPSPSAQPFWYAGVLEGAMRLTPGWEWTVLGFVLPIGLWLPVLVLAAFFTVLLLYPFLDRRRTGDQGFHHLLDRPSDVPVRAGLGAAAITFFTVLWAATWLSPVPPEGAPVPLVTVPGGVYTAYVYGLRVALFVLPPLAYAVTVRVCRRRRAVT